MIPFAYHILPAIDWLNKQTEIKKYTVRILNVPRRAKPVHIERLVRNRLKEAKGPQPPAGEEFKKTTTIVMDKDA